MERIVLKIAYLAANGIPEKDASMAMVVAGRFTVGSVLEEQAELNAHNAIDHDQTNTKIDHEAAFEAGLELIIRGLATSTKCGGS